METEMGDYERCLIGLKKKDLTIAEQLHEGYRIIDMTEMFICEIFKKHYPEIYIDGFDFDIGCDSYDNSIEIYFKSEMPAYPWEPNKAIRKEIYDLGFSIVYWNFISDLNPNNHEEIRGFEPRRFKNRLHQPSGVYGYVDERYNDKDWVGSSNDCRSLMKDLFPSGGNVT